MYNLINLNHFFTIFWGCVLCSKKVFHSPINAVNVEQTICEFLKFTHYIQQLPSPFCWQTNTINILNSFQWKCIPSWRLGSFNWSQNYEIGLCCISYFHVTPFARKSFILHLILLYWRLQLIRKHVCSWVLFSKNRFCFSNYSTQ